VTIANKEIAATYLAQFAHMKLYESRPYLEYLTLYPKKTRKKPTKNVKSGAI